MTFFPNLISISFRSLIPIFFRTLQISFQAHPICFQIPSFVWKWLNSLGVRAFEVRSQHWIPFAFHYSHAELLGLWIVFQHFFFWNYVSVDWPKMEFIIFIWFFWEDCYVTPLAIFKYIYLEYEGWIFQPIAYLKDDLLKSKSMLWKFCSTYMLFNFKNREVNHIINETVSF